MVKWTLRVFTVLFVAVFLYSGYRILNKMRDYMQIEQAYDHIADLVMQPASPDVATEDDLLENTAVPQDSQDPFEAERRLRRSSRPIHIIRT